MNRLDLGFLRRALIGTLAVAVVAVAGGFTSCSTTTELPIFGQVLLNPTTISFACSSPTPTTFVATQTNFTGTFAAQSNNTSSATVAATSPPGTFVVTPGSSGASTTITVTGGGGSQGTVNVGHCPVCVRHHDMWKGTR